MTNIPGTIPAAEALRLADLIAPTDGGIASRVLAKNGGGNVTLFAFDAGEGLSEHTTPFDALVLTLDVWHVALFGDDVGHAEHDARHQTIEGKCQNSGHHHENRPECE